MTPDDIFNSEFRECFDTIRHFVSEKLSISVPAVLEFQYALNHLCLARQKFHEVKKLKKTEAAQEKIREVEEKRLKHLEKASGHFHRSHLDMIKHHILEAQKDLAKRGAHLAAYFGLRQGELRAAELRMLGDRDRTSIFGEYRKLLAEILPFYENREVGQLFSLSGQRVEAEARSLSDYPDEATTNAYLEWADLEARLAAFSGKRWYHHILLVIISFCEKELDKGLPLWIATLKLALLERLNQCYESEVKSKTEVSGEAGSSGFCMFTLKGYDKADRAKWAVCLEMISDFDGNVGDRSAEDIKKLAKLYMLKEGINELFRAYPDLAKHFTKPQAPPKPPAA